MATTETPWNGQGASKLYLQSGQFSGTMKTSLSHIGTFGTGIEWDGTNTPWSLFQNAGGNARLLIQSGKFSATIKASMAASAAVEGISYDNNGHSPWCDQVAKKLTLQSGQFSATVKTSITSSPFFDIKGITALETDTAWAKIGADKLMVTSGQFSVTVKTSRDISSINTTPRQLSWDGVNTPWSASTGDEKLLLQSGQFSATLKTSLNVNAIDNGVSGIATDDVTNRLGGGAVFTPTAVIF